MGDFLDLVEKYLTIRKLPVSEREHHEGSVHQDLQSSVVQSVVSLRWLLVEISKLKPLCHIHIENTHKTNGEQNR